MITSLAVGGELPRELPHDVHREYLALVDAYERGDVEAAAQAIRARTERAVNVVRTYFGATTPSRPGAAS
jgi:DNA-binding GntR family transcriptional regulator